MSRYRIIMRNNRFIAQRKGLLFWHSLGHDMVFSTCFTDSAWFIIAAFYTEQDAEDGIKTAIVLAGIQRAHAKYVKHFPPFTTPAKLAKAGP
jgi:hypothetical protein